MPDSVAEAYLLIFRSSMVPVIGEAVPLPFNEQIELDKWHWELKYDEKANDGKGATTSGSDSDDKKPAFKGDELIREVQRMQVNENYKQDKRNENVRALIKKANDAQTKADKASGDDKSDDSKGDDNKLTFTFSKNVDLASTQLLNSMKAGERMPRAVLTLFHRSKNAPVTLIVTFGSVVFTKYELKVQPTDKMSDMTEDWTAIYETVDYVYQNRPAASGPNGITKGTARVFKMKLKSLF